jgi:hypothetical protein
MRTARFCEQRRALISREWRRSRSNSCSFFSGSTGADTGFLNMPKNISFYCSLSPLNSIFFIATEVYPDRLSMEVIKGLTTGVIEGVVATSLLRITVISGEEEKDLQKKQQHKAKWKKI